MSVSDPRRQWRAPSSHRAPLILSLSKDESTGPLYVMGNGVAAAFEIRQAPCQAIAIAA